MGRKNNRLVSLPDKRFDNFAKSFMEEKKKQKQKEEVIHYNKRPDYFRPVQDYRKERLEYAIQQLEANDISYHVINEEKTFMECQRKHYPNQWIKFYASSGYIMGSESRGIKTLIKILLEV